VHWLDPSAAGIPLVQVTETKPGALLTRQLKILTAQQRRNHWLAVEELRRGLIRVFVSQQLLPRVAEDRLRQGNVATSQGRRLHT
jgi:hypothetical protein